MRILLLVLGCFLYSGISAQIPPLYGMHAEWDDKLTQWTIYTVDEEVDGEMNMVWEAINRIDEWDFSFEGVHGKIRQKLLGNKEQWEVRIGNEVVTILQQWPGDYGEWRITDNSRSIDFRLDRREDPYFWSLKQSDRFGKFQVYTEYTGDVRDWVIIDELDPNFNLALKMAMVFTPLIPLLPRN